mmetsp:Transcript_13004/g.26703  ORF Transcript_13004/g.26703 Transcript_13004/m.26703 type:complete len:316 (+) Transcript_13004:1254-2201(+)
MTVTESPALYILSCEAYVISLKQQRTKRHCLGKTPVDIGSRFSHFLTALEDFGHLPMELESLWHFSSLHPNVSKGVNVHSRGTNTAVLPGTLESRPFGTQPILGRWPVCFACLVVGFVTLKGEFADFFGFFLGHGTFTKQSLFVYFQSGRMPGDGLVQFRLGKHRLIQFVMAIATVTDHVDDDIRTPLVSPFNRRLEGTRHSNWIITIAMKDRTIERLSKIRRIRSRSAIDGIGSEPNLIIDNYMNRPANVEIVNSGKLHRFIDYTLSSEGSVSVEENGNNIFSVFGCVSAVELLGASFSHDYGVDAFKVGRVGD